MLVKLKLDDIRITSASNKDAGPGILSRLDDISSSTVRARALPVDDNVGPGTVRIGGPFTCSTFLRKVVYCDVNHKSSNGAIVDFEW